MTKIMTAAEAVRIYLKNGMTIAFNGFIGAAHPEELSLTIQSEFLESGSPRDLTVVFASGQGDRITKGLNHLGEEGLVAKVIGGHWGLVPRLQKLALENKISAYNIPQGVLSHLFRETAAGKPGVITHVGLNTFVDPRLEGGKLNQKATEAGDIVKLVEIEGRELLLYRAIPIDVAIIRATYADMRGNCTFQKEGTIADAVVLAQAAKNSGGKVIVQVEQVVEHQTLDPRLIRLPGIYVDCLVVSKPENHMQTFGCQYNPAFSGEIRVPVNTLPPIPLDERKVIVRRAAMELKPNAVTNLGIGMAENVARIAAEEGLDGMVLTTEVGSIGGIPASGLNFGVATNYDCLLEQPSQFDFYDGGGLDMAFLGLAQTDCEGNINVSKFGPKIAGCGGFINITQNTKKVIFCGTFTGGCLDVEIGEGRLEIKREGSIRKFVKHVEQITISGAYARKTGQKVLYITERAVFELTGDGLVLVEVAPGINTDREILALMDFAPVISKSLKLMDGRLFLPGKMGLKEGIEI